MFCFFLQIGIYNIGLTFVRPVVERLAWYGLFSIRTRAVRRQQRIKMQMESSDKNHNGMLSASVQ